MRAGRGPEVLKELRSPRQSRDPAARHPKANQRDGAKTEYAQVLSTTPAGVEALYHMGQAHYQRREHSAAITLIREALALDARLVPAHITLGRILQESGRVDEAIASFRQAIAIEPENGEAHTRLAGALETQGRIDDAIEQYRR